MVVVVHHRASLQPKQTRHRCKRKIRKIVVVWDGSVSFVVRAGWFSPALPDLAKSTNGTMFLCAIFDATDVGRGNCDS